MNTLKTLALAGVVGATMLFAPSNASASDVGVSIGIGAPGPVIVDGGYHEQVWVEPVYRTEVYYGSPRRVIVTPGYYRPGYSSGVYVAPRSSFYFGGSYGDRHHHHHHSSHNNDGYYRRDKPGRYR